MSPLAITTPSQPLCAGPSGPGRVGMRLSAYFVKRLHGMLSWNGYMCMCKHAHFYLPASAAGWLTPKRVSTTPSTPPDSHAQHGKFRATTTPSQPQIRRPLPSPQSYRHIPELTCEINSRIDTPSSLLPSTQSSRHSSTPDILYRFFSDNPSRFCTAICVVTWMSLHVQTFTL